jgi:hypothetical protein
VLPLVLFNLFGLCVFIGGIVAVAVNWLQRRHAKRDAAAGASPLHRGRLLGVSVLCAGLGFLVLFDVTILAGSGQVTSTLSPAQVTGTWRGSDGATLVLRPDGTFTGTGLPTHIGWQPSAGGPLDSTNPANVRGTWSISPVSGPDKSPASVIFCYDRRTDPDSCDQFGLLLRHASSSPAPSWYLGDPDNIGDQYAVNRQSGS